MSQDDSLRRRDVEALVYDDPRGRRFTQRSPIMLDVWTQFALEGPGPHDLLLIADRDSTAGALADELAERLLADPPSFGPAPDAGPSAADASAADAAADALDALGLVATQAVVAARLTFRQLLRVALPMTPWWTSALCEDDSGIRDRSSASPDLTAILFASQPARRATGSFPGMRAPAPSPVRDPATRTSQRALGCVYERPAPAAEARPAYLRDDLLWLVRVAGAIAHLHALAPCWPPTDEQWQRFRAERESPQVLVAALATLLRDVPPAGAQPLWAVHGNRRAEMAMRRSMPTIKADAARRVFDVTGKGIRWAVLDSGIDATHVAFRRREPGRGMAQLSPEPDEDFTAHTRVTHSYDFTCARELLALSPRQIDRYPAGIAPILLEQLADPQRRSEVRAAAERTSRHHGARAAATTDWQVWEPLLRIPHTKAGYRVPRNPHGTHVAGILAADWRVGDLSDDVVAPELELPARQVARTGVCPELELWDLRVLDDRGETSELVVLAAMQFVRATNVRHEHQELHGTNLSFSLRYQMESYACGATPACVECERLVASGVVVVAAAGNLGRTTYQNESGQLEDGYRVVGITDPGNAPSVITVGATHRFEPHAYGVSYFSSRGPTGDGRVKPDLVAPGEKVTSTVPGDRELSMDGTSAAAPHVSGAAALLLCRYPELRGRPAEVKRILCSTATDLGRDRYSQGAGLVDILRAMESV